MSSLAHFTGVLYTPAWVFLCLFTTLAVVGQNIEQAEVKHPRFFVCSHQLRKINLTFGCLSEHIEQEDSKEKLTKPY